MATPESRLRKLREKSRNLARRLDERGTIIKLRCYAGITIRPAMIGAVVETLCRNFRFGRRGAELWAAVIDKHPDATNWELAIAGGKTARRVFEDGRMRQCYRYQQAAAPSGAA